MIIGSGMLARAFSTLATTDTTLCIYASGVSDSRCTDPTAFSREEFTLTNALDSYSDLAFIYFGTCSVDDPEMNATPYVKHKCRMEVLVREHATRSLIIRLPQVAGATQNPATLLSFLARQIKSSTTFDVWTKARRNIIDVDDVVSTIKVMLEDHAIFNNTFNVANTVSYTIPEIVASLEKVLAHKALYRECPQGATYDIDLTRTLPYFASANIHFDDEYLDKVVRKYYGAS